MKFISSKIKHKLRASFFLLIILSTAGGIVSYILLSKVTEYQRLKNKVDALVIMLNQARKAEKDFIMYDRKSVEFLESKKSANILLHKQSVEEMDELLKKLKESPIIGQLQLNSEIGRIDRSIDSYENSFTNLVNLFHKRGFKDHGLEGEMRVYVHDLQKAKSPEEQYRFFRKLLLKRQTAPQ